MEWIGVTITALAGLAGVVYTARNANRKDLARIAFDREQTERLIETAKREAIRANVSALVDRFADIERVTWPSPDDDRRVTFEDGFFDLDHWDSRERLFRREIALVHDETTRKALGTVVDAISGSYWLVRKRARYKSVAAGVREVAELGFEIGSAWLRGETIAETELRATDSLREELDGVYAELEEQARHESEARLKEKEAK